MYTGKFEIMCEYELNELGEMLMKRLGRKSLFKYQPKKRVDFYFNKDVEANVFLNKFDESEDSFLAKGVIEIETFKFSDLIPTSFLIGLIYCISDSWLGPSIVSVIIMSFYTFKVWAAKERLSGFVSELLRDIEYASKGRVISFEEREN